MNFHNIYFYGENYPGIIIKFSCGISEYLKEAVQMHKLDLHCSLKFCYKTVYLFGGTFISGISEA